MSSGSEKYRPGVIERLDLALATRFSAALGPSSEQRIVDIQTSELSLGEDARCEWISGLLSVRNYRVSAEDVRVILNGAPSRFREEHQEFGLVHGLNRVLELLEVQAADGKWPSGKRLVELFSVLTEGIARFRNNAIRKDQPWDSLLYLGYPRTRDLGRIIDSFTKENCYRDIPAIFESLHPVRQACRVLWRYARIAPHPDLNLVMALVAFNACLRASGYPLLVPGRADRSRLMRLIPGPPPRRIVHFELRLLNQIESISVPD
ncbi:MAG: hypothetical protein ACYTG5_13580 [Planctomycetota bacterium]|jgi:hypothetical protein